MAGRGAHLGSVRALQGSHSNHMTEQAGLLPPLAHVTCEMQQNIGKGSIVLLFYIWLPVVERATWHNSVESV